MKEIAAGNLRKVKIKEKISINENKTIFSKTKAQQIDSKKSS